MANIVQRCLLLTYVHEHTTKYKGNMGPPRMRVTPQGGSHEEDSMSGITMLDFVFRPQDGQ